MEETNDLGRLENERCAGCHTMMDPIGIGFDAYDPTGALTEGNETEQGRIKGADSLGLPKTFDSPVGLAHALADNAHVRKCVAKHWFRYAMGRKESKRDEPALERIYEEFEKSDGNIRDLIVAISVSDAFRQRSLEARQEK